MKIQNKEQRINESAELHQRIEDLEAEATKRKKAEEALREALKEVKQLKNQLREENSTLLPDGRDR